ncbi:hypothetical protein EDB81DRAFT_799449 [Dactylonectria macrodidyma]|uniref:Uncharacterized protein n=1 Tax=Dactylonectria macrodidyma TaxID=307937 RepID=A0A9P9J3W8_9HYPO|nr:hypothetical protein EDB81DRAFT_799449 [Dactylonectria macrodidyma]
MDFLESGLAARALSKADIFYTTNQATGLHLAAYFGLDAAEDALISRSHDPNVPGGYGRTPIFYASKKGHCCTIKVLVGHGAKIDAPCVDDWNRWAVLEAVQGSLYNVVELLLDIEAKSDPGSETWEYKDAKT